MARAIGTVVPHRQPRIPTLWLMTDERLGDDLWKAISRLPRGAGIVFRHYSVPLAERRRLFARVIRIARARGLIVVRSGSRCGFGEAGTHGPQRRRTGGIRTAPAHSRSEAIAAARNGIDALFISPVFSTRSHADAATLGARGARRVAQGLALEAIALGGMDARRFRALHGLFHGWAAIDAWSVKRG